MIRRFTFICLVIAAGSGLHLYSVKRDAQLQGREVVRLNHEAKEVRNHATLLHAEYDLLSDPDRLKDLANQVLKLLPTDPKQYVAYADLDKRLPAVAPLPAPPATPTPPEAKVEPAPAPEPAPAAGEAPKPELVAKAPERPTVEPGSDKASQLAHLMASLDPSAPAAKPAPTPAPAPVAQPAVVAAAAAPKPAPKPIVVAESRPPQPRPVAAPVVQHPVQTATIAPLPRPMPVVATTPPPAAYGGSSLGMARMHAAPARYVPPNNGDDP